MKIGNIASSVTCLKIFYKAVENQCQESNLRFQISTLCSSVLFGSIVPLTRSSAAYESSGCSKSYQLLELLVFLLLVIFMG